MPPRPKPTPKSSQKQEPSKGTAAGTKPRGRPRKVVDEGSDGNEFVPPVRIVTKKMVPKSPEPEYLDFSDSDDGERVEPSEKLIDDEAEESVEFVEQEGEEDNEDIQMDPDDSLYPEEASPARVRVNRLAAPITPPLSTRRAAARTYTERDSPDMPGNTQGPTLDYSSPTKRQRGSGSSGQAATPKGNSSKAVSAKGSNKKALDVGAKLPAVKERDTGAISDIDDDLTFDDIPSIKGIEKDTKAPTKLIYQEDLTTLVVLKLPNKCEVACKQNQDAFLYEKGCYENLPNLNACSLLPIKNSEPRGAVMFSQWKSQCPGLRVKPAMEAITFISDRNYCNPSRISPLLLAGRLTKPISKRYDYTINHGNSALFLTPVMVSDSFVQTMNPNLRFSGHYLSGIYHSEEWARFGAAVGMVGHQESMQIAMWKDAITFGTKGSNDTVYGSESATSGYAVPGLLNPASSPSKSNHAKDSKSTTRLVMPLSYGERVPVYNACGKSFPYTADTFDHLPEHFDRYDEEIPFGSLAVVCYTCQMYQYLNEWRIANFAQWVLLLGLPNPNGQV